MAPMPDVQGLMSPYRRTCWLSQPRTQLGKILWKCYAFHCIFMGTLDHYNAFNEQKNTDAIFGNKPN